MPIDAPGATSVQMAASIRVCGSPGSDVEILRELCVLLDVLEAQLRLAAHQPFHQVRGLAGFRTFFFVVAMRHADPKQRALLRVHGGFLELARRHLAEALEAADLDLALAGELR